jgi:CheY-like chemotaxis protein
LEQEWAKGKSVLVVEDEPGIARLCARTLTGEGFQVDVAINGEVALALWRKKFYDLCVSDIMTPYMNGIELYQHLEKENPEAAARFIFTTGNLLNAEIKIFLDKTGRPLLPKPFSPENLREIVKEFMYVSIYSCIKRK